MKRSAYEVPAAARSARLGLTSRELQVLCLMLDGHEAPAAAATLSLSPQTVKYYCRLIYVKLGVRTRQGLANAVIARARPGKTFWSLIEEAKPNV